MGKIWKAAGVAGVVLGAILTGLELLEALSFLGIRVKLMTISIWADIIARVVGLFLVSTAISFIIIYAFVSIKNLIASFQNRAIADLSRLQQCAEEIIDWIKAPIPKQGGLSRPSPQSQSDFNVLSKKYESWIREKRSGGITFETQVSESVNCIAILRAHGYLRGRYMIWKRYREWERKVADAENKKGRETQKENES